MTKIDIYFHSASFIFRLDGKKMLGKFESAEFIYSFAVKPHIWMR